jgi:hypothetical protein
MILKLAIAMKKVSQEMILTANKDVKNACPLFQEKMLRS